MDTKQLIGKRVQNIKNKRIVINNNWEGLDMKTVDDVAADFWKRRGVQ